jgi:hypothetical protein
LKNHEQFPQTTEVSAIFHLFGDYIGWVNFSHGMNHIESFVLYQFTADRTFAELNVASCFRSHIVQPLHASVIVVVLDGGRGDIVKGMAIFRNTAQEIPKVYNLFQCSVSSSNLGFTRAERGPFLTSPKPSDGATVLENNATIHNVELEER